MTQDILEGMKTPSKSILDVGVQNAMNKSGTGPGVSSVYPKVSK